MPIHTSWDNAQKTIIKYMVDGKWTVQEALIAVEEATKLMDEVPHSVDFIGEFAPSSYFVTADLTSLFRKVDIMMVRSRRYRYYTVAVNLPRFALTLLNVMARITPDVSNNIYCVSSMKEAYALLAEKRGRHFGAGTGTGENITYRPDSD